MSMIAAVLGWACLTECPYVCTAVAMWPSLCVQLYVYICIDADFWVSSTCIIMATFIYV